MLTAKVLADAFKKRTSPNWLMLLEQFGRNGHVGKDGIDGVGLEEVGGQSTMLLPELVLSG